MANNLQLAIYDEYVSSINQNRFVFRIHRKYREVVLFCDEDGIYGAPLAFAEVHIPVRCIAPIAQNPIDGNGLLISL